VAADEALRNQAGRLIAAGILPARRPDRIWGGPGSGDHCLVCNRAVTREETQMELEFAREGRPAPATVHVHLECFAALEQERRRLEDGATTAESPRAADVARELNGSRYLDGT